MASLAQINIRFKADLSGFSSDMQNVMRKMQQTGTQMAAVGKSMSTYITLPLLAAGGAAIKFASDYNESLNKVEVAFGPASTSVKNFAKDSLTSFGIAEGSALDMAAQYGDMATSMGLSQTASAQLSTELVGLAGDLASFKNIGIDQANTALAGIFTGETESLKKLGIVMTEQNLQQFALSKGIKTQIKDMDQASKVNLRYAYIMANTTNAQGDFERTGGGAANQMRIFQESLKQVAQQFGTVVLPYFTKAIVFVNGLIKGFSELSPASKALIVGIAGVAAAIGPLLSAAGNLIGFIPKMIVQFQGLQAIILANPYTAAAVGLAAIALAVYAFVSNAKGAVTAQSALNDAVKKGNENAAAEVGALDKLYASATNVKLSTNEREKAVKDLQALYPAYFKNIDTENIKNGSSVGIYNQLRDAIFAKSRAMAIDNELQNRANERIAKELEIQQRIVDARKRYNDIKNGKEAAPTVAIGSTGGVTQTFVSQSDKIKEAARILGAYKTDLAKFYADAKKEDALLLAAKQEYSSKTGKLAENDAQKIKEAEIGITALTNANEKLFKSGSIAFFEAQISDLQKLQKEIPTTNAAWQTYEDKITAIQKKIDELQGKGGVKLPKPEIPTLAANEPAPIVSFSLEELKNQLSFYEDLREKLATTDAEYTRLSQNINNTKIQINAIEGKDELITSYDEIAVATNDFSSTLSESLNQLGQDMAVSFGEAVGSFISGSKGLESVFSGMIGLVSEFMKSLGKQLVALGVARIAFDKLKISGVGAVAAGITLIALSTAFQSSLKTGPKFANGGVVGGSSYYGDKILARVNSGEMIANNGQQKRIWNAMNGAGGDVAVNLVGNWDIEGSKMKLLLDRAETRNNRER